MKINGKKILGALGLMAAGSLLTMVETARELTTAKHAQENRDFIRVALDGIENETLDIKPAGFGKMQVSCMYREDEVPDYAKK